MKISKKSVLLLNPPGTKPFLRDYYCSKVSKTGYLYHPVDLTFQSAILKNDFHVHVIDAIAEKFTPNDVFNSINRMRPDAVLCLIGAAAWEEDRKFIRDLRDAYSGIIAATGDVFQGEYKDAFDSLPEIDAILLNFASPGFRDWLTNPDDTGLDMIVRRGAEIAEGRRSPMHGEFKVGTPLYDLFPHRKYRYPFVRRRPFATILTDYGCPYPCKFCIMNVVGYRTRPIDEVLDEMRHLKQAGYRELYVNDQTFGANRKRAFELLEKMHRENFGFGWVCFTRTDVLDEDLAVAMKMAGCHTIMFGVESANRNILDSYKKSVNQDDAFRTMDICRRYKLRSVATLLIGFPEDTNETIEETIRLALNLDPDYASFNFAVPRRGTFIRNRSIELGLAAPDRIDMDQAGEEIAMATQFLSREEIAQWRRKALRMFYLRPGYIVRKALSLRTPYEFTTTILEGIGVAGNFM